MQKRAKGKSDSKATRTKTVRLQKGFIAYQKAAAETVHGKFHDQKGRIASMLGLGSETGSILDSYKRYLRDAIDFNLNRAFLRVELGDLLWYIAVVATACGLDLDQIANANLLKVRARYKRKFRGKKPNIGCTIPSDSSADIVKDFSDYQFEASKYSERNLRGPESPIAPLCGLAGATGAILKFPKDNLGTIGSRSHRHFFKTELGDLLWYLSAVATASNLNLGDIANENLRRARDLYPVSKKPSADLFSDLPRLDDPRKPTECFPTNGDQI